MAGLRGVTGLVLAAGGSRRLGEAKQLLPYRGRTLPDATLDMARACGFERLLGDQPGVDPASVRRVTEVPTPIGVCRYRDGLGHPFLFRRPVFEELAALHGDKAVWKLVHSGRHPVPIDVDTRDDYRRLLAGDTR